MDITEANILSVIRRCPKYLSFASNDDERMIMRAGVCPRHILLSVFEAASEDSQKGRLIESKLDKLVIKRKVEASRSHLRNNPRDRSRPIVTRFDVEKPNIAAYSHEPVTYRVWGRDRLLLWYAAARHDLSGSRGEGYGLYRVLQFLRQPAIYRAWRRFTSESYFRGKIPKETE
jgi:hypothetical protein